MKKTRVPKGEKYWYFSRNWGNCKDWWRVYQVKDTRRDCDNRRFDEGNYFFTQDDAKAMVAKLRAVLKGADVIEMPSEEEIKTSQDNIENLVVYDIRNYNGEQLVYCKAINKGAELMADWLKSKIIK